jgi:hypothetical protein
MITLPLSPTDLVAIYKEGSKKVLEVDHILIYLSNTGFTTGFSSVDESLLLRYVEIGFLVDSPLLSRIWSNILRVKAGIPLSGPDKVLLSIFSEKQIENFISNNSGAIEMLEHSVRSMVVAVIDNAMEQESSGSESGLGLNVGYILRDAIDTVMGVIAKKGLTENVDISVFNNKSKFFGGDIFKWMHDNGITNLIASMLPKDHEVFTSGAFKQD